MKTFSKKFILATYSDGGYQLEEFDNLNDAVLKEHYTGEWAVLTPVSFKIEEV